MNLLRLIPGYRAMEAMTTESSTARVKAESDVRDLRNRIMELQDQMLALRQELSAKQDQIAEDARLLFDQARVDMRLSPVFHSPGDLHPAPPVPETQMHQVARPRAEHLVAEMEADFLRSISELQ